MSGKRIQLKRGTTAQNSTFTGLNGEVTVDTTKKTLVVHDGTTVGGTVLAKDSDVALKVDEVNTSLALKVNNSEKGVANGLATLDGNGKVVLTQIPDSVLGQLEYMGTWNFTTMPTATQKGQYWIANTSGNGYVVGDWAVWNGSAFDKVDNTDAVASVAGRTGNVVLTKSDVGLASVDNTADSVKNVLSATKWTTARTLSLAGDVTGSASIDGSGNVTINATVVDDSHSHIIDDVDGLQAALDNIDATAELNSNMMTKAQFNALAEERKANRAGSGFDEWGKHSNLIGYPNVNEGIVSDPTAVNVFGIGTSDTAGVSKTKEPIVTVNGILQKIQNVARPTGTGAIVTLPTAPTIYPHDTVLTAEQIASGVIKHADASNSGLITNGKFDTDTSGWTAGGSTISLVNNAIEVTNTVGYGYATQAIPTIIGKKYIAECNVISGTAVTGILFVGTTAGTNNITSKPTTSGYVSVEFVATTTTTYISVLNGEQTVGKTKLYDNIAVYPADAISRSDLVFLESWHEDISEKNFVYPLGNVQYLGGNSDGLTGIANGSFTGFETYSLFGNWQTSSALIGKGYVWSSLTEAQKKAFISNAENNCYLDGDKIIQVRYRVRVQLGEDSNSMAKATVQGKAVVPSTVLFTVPVTSVDAGLYLNTSTTYTYTGTNTSAISIANVHRKNQGMYHNVYNPNGTKKASDNNLWYNTSVSFTSISACFDSAKLLTTSGYIGTVNGRPDGLFYDQIHEGDILDLRNSSKKVEDYNRLISREFNKLVAGTNRGKEGEYTLYYRNITGTNLSVIMATSIGNQPPTSIDRDTYFVINNSSSAIQIAYWTGSSATGYIQVNSGTSSNIEVPFGTSLYIQGNNSSTVTTVNVTVVRVKGSRNSTTRTKSNTLLHCDIIGNPTNYPTSWKQSGVFGTPLVVAEDGTSLLPNGTLDTFKLSRKANATPLLCLRSTDNGTTWTSFTPTFSTTTNTITLTDEPAANLVMVYYQTHTSMAIPVVNSEVLEIGDVYATQANNYRNYLVNTLIGKTSICSVVNVFEYSSSLYKFTSPSIIDAPSGKMYGTNNYGTNPLHEPIVMYFSSSPAIKVFPYLTRLNGKAYLNLVFKEMKHNGTSWGDDAKFNIANNVSTTTDNNAQTVLIGQKTVELPYFIGADE